ncbi:MAG: HEAT repeat domain-containing protein [Candidatus Poribacteria bacterium]|nr:HEAT repeat domain-containing protein [Candidatus Poribacteria bacterium]MDE0504810.1 HEAT repeat domain-containing protein [Candidatus Poribacteria bacterium]
MRRQKTFFGVICLTIFAIASSIHGNGLTVNDIVEQARDALVRYKQGDRMAYYSLDATRDERLFPVFLEALDDSDANVRILAVNQLTNYRKLEAIEPIAGLLKHDKDAGVRAASASSLGQLGYRDSSPALLDALHDESSSVVEAAIRGLGWLKSKEAIEPLKGKLRGDNEEDWMIQRASADALQDITGEDWSQGIHEFPPELRVRDADITFEAYKRAMVYLGERVPEMIDTTITTEELTSGEKFYVGYWNHLTIIEGYHLKQCLQIQAGTLQQTLQSQKLDEATGDDVINARKTYDEARQKYEGFLADSVWAD